MRSAARFDRAAARWGNPPGRPAAEEPSSTAAVRLSLPFQILRNRLPCAPSLTCRAESRAELVVEAGRSGLVHRCGLLLQLRQLPLDVLDEQVRHVVAEATLNHD